ncbi:MAG TPA: ester cyclase [Steroidobacteraceae bacterium]|nr:ester cyclase [Steroidobacteraceae bacterium]
MNEQEHNKSLVRRIYASCWNKGDMQAIDEIIALDVRHEQFPTGWPTGRDGFKMLVSFWRRAFPDIHEEAVALIAEGDRVASRFRLRGTHLGDFYGVPGTGRRVDIYGAEIFRFQDGILVDYLYHEDTLGLFFQLGVIPLPRLELAGVNSAVG